jgi:hypothetical protein
MPNRAVCYGFALALLAASCPTLGAAPLNPGVPRGNPVLDANGRRAVGQGGGVNADFDSLIDLIVSTVDSESWAENGGGEAEIRPFVGGVHVDAQGTLRQLKNTGGPVADKTSAGGTLAKDLARIKASAASSRSAVSNEPLNPRTLAKLRCVSLVRLEKEIARRVAARQPLDEAMLTLAGLRRVEYLFVDVGSGDLAIAGPAGDWVVSDERRLVASDTGAPVVRLDDLLTLLRRDANSPFGCSIDPRPESLAKAQAYLSGHAIPTSRRGRDKWLEEVRACVGLQDLTYRGVPADSRVACVLGEADYHMKLLGMGLADGAVGMQSYLDSIRVNPGETAPSLGAVRWWFGMNYAAVETSEAHDAFRIVGAGVKLQSENESLAERGVRVPSGAADELAQAYAVSFTSHFAALCAKHPVYAELRNVFDLSLILAIVQSEGLAEKVNWSPGLLHDAQRLPLPKYRAPTTVETVANLRVVNRRQVVAGVSGGVWAQPLEVAKMRLRTSKAYGPLNDARSRAAADDRWWWDIEE